MSPGFDATAPPSFETRPGTAPLPEPASSGEGCGGAPLQPRDGGGRGQWCALPIRKGDTLPSHWGR